MKRGIAADQAPPRDAMWCAYRASISISANESGTEEVATTTYGYDYAGNRVIQNGTSTTWIYPFKWYSVASSTGSGAKYATTTDYVFNGDTLVSTIDQELASGTATGSAQTRFVHPDHLGSTNVVTDASGGIVQTLEYYPYGSTRISSGENAESRQYIGQFTDNSTLSYLNARYYDSSRGQFLSQDPTFLALGNPSQLEQFSQQDQQNFLSDPQQLNGYSYGRDNPITRKDPKGNQSYLLPPALAFFDYLSFLLLAHEYRTAVNASPDGTLTPAEQMKFDQMAVLSMVPGASKAAGLIEGPRAEGGVTLITEGAKIYIERGPGGAYQSNPSNFFQVAQTTPSVLTSTPLPAFLTQNNYTYYRNSSGLLSPTPTNSSTQNQASQGGGGGGGSYQAQIASIQAQIASIQAQLNAYIQSQSPTKSNR